MGFKPGGPPGGPKPLPNGLLSSLGSEMKTYILALRGMMTDRISELVYAKFKIGIQYPFSIARDRAQNGINIGNLPL